MCGLFGVTNLNIKDLTKARESLHTLHHRGPDQWNEFFEESLYMGHQRLSIMDLSDAGIQPMISPDGNVIITVNGEIYNFESLKSELMSKYEFKSQSDSEVILFGYIEWGIDELLRRIDGMYAIAIYDKFESKLYLVRDRVGIKPIYYSFMKGQLCWASELKAIREFYDLKPGLDYDVTALYDYLTYRYVPTPKTIYTNVYKLEPASYLEINLKTESHSKTIYWQLEVTECEDDIETAASKISELLVESVREQMVSDVNVGFFLSGGLDSSAVVAVATKLRDQVHTFSIGFEDKLKDEAPAARKTSEYFRTKHSEQKIGDGQLSAMLDDIVGWYDEPNALSSTYPNYCVAKLARQEVTVALTGDGGDEVFGGYIWYKYFEAISRYSSPKFRFFKKITNILKSRGGFIGKIARRFETLFLLDDLERYTVLMGGMLRDEKKRYRECWGIPDEYDDYWYFRKFYNENYSVYTRLQFLDFHTFLPDACLSKVDRTSMAVSLECRVPLLSKKIIEYSFSLKEDVRLSNGDLKSVFKLAVSDILPSEVIKRPKKGFSAPLKKSMQSFDFKGKTIQEKFLDRYWLNNG